MENKIDDGCSVIHLHRFTIASCLQMYVSHAVKTNKSTK